MSNREAIQMMANCEAEIRNLRAEIEHLRPKAEAYESIAAILGLSPQPSRGASPDIVWTLNSRIRELQAAMDAERNPVPPPVDPNNYL